MTKRKSENQLLMLDSGEDNHKTGSINSILDIVRQFAI
tara:strand:+ start:1117 stop:1230 length:114 start_codon:yes stop_codon:yes gene_type:complete